MQYKTGYFFTVFKVVCFLLILAGGAVFAAASGDVNGSGTVDINDALLIARFVSGQTVAGFNAGVADVDCSGKPDIVDALLVARFSAGLIFQFPCTVTATPTPTRSPTPTPTPTGGNITVWLAGDSTMANGGASCPIGYGAKLGAFFDSRVTVRNLARGGRSINNWMYNVGTETDSNGDCVIVKDAAGKPAVTTDWQTMLDGMRAGDYVIISFGINDGTSTCPRHTGQNTFIADLGIMATAVKARGANPVFMTPVSMIRCSGSTAIGSRGVYVTYTINAGQQFDVPVLDLHQLSVNLYNSLSFCPLPGGASDVSASTGGAVGAFFCDDHTHFDTPGAEAIARIIAKAISDQHLGLAAYLVK